jgi:hypothetical protein
MTISQWPALGRRRDSTRASSYPRRPPADRRHGKLTGWSATLPASGAIGPNTHDDEAAEPRYFEWRSSGRAAGPCQDRAFRGFMFEMDAHKLKQLFRRTLIQSPRI